MQDGWLWLQVNRSSKSNVRSILDILCKATRLAVTQQCEPRSEGASSTQTPGQQQSLCFGDYIGLCRTASAGIAFKQTWHVPYQQLLGRSCRLFVKCHCIHIAGWQDVGLEASQLQCHCTAMIAGCVTTQHVGSVIAQQAKSSMLDTLQGLQPREKRLLMLVHQSKSVHSYAPGEMMTFADPPGACAMWSPCPLLL